MHVLRCDLAVLAGVSAGCCAHRTLRHNDTICVSGRFATDVDLINEHLNALLAGKKVMSPNYDMKTGYRVRIPWQRKNICSSIRPLMSRALNLGLVLRLSANNVARLVVPPSLISTYNNHVVDLTEHPRTRTCTCTHSQLGPGTPFSIPDGGILVIEGIHALNPQYTKTLPREKVSCVCCVRAGRQAGRCVIDTRECGSGAVVCFSQRSECVRAARCLLHSVG